MYSLAEGTRGVVMADKPMEEGPTEDRAGAARAAEYRRLAQVHEREAAQSHIAEVRTVQMRLAQSYLALAENEEWLEGQTAPDA
jgi:hypothetical protein